MENNIENYFDEVPTRPILELILEQYPDVPFMIADGFDSCVIGVWEEKLVYSSNHIVMQLAYLEEESMSEDDAWEHFHYNIEGSYVGEHTPIFIETF